MGQHAARHLPGAISGADDVSILVFMTRYQAAACAKMDAVQFGQKLSRRGGPWLRVLLHFIDHHSSAIADKAASPRFHAGRHA